MWPQREREELGWHLVVLLVGEPGQRRDRAGIHGLDEGFGPATGRFGVARLDLGEPYTAQAPDAGAHDGVRDQALLDPTERRGGGG